MKIGQRVCLGYIIKLVYSMRKHIHIHQKTLLCWSFKRKKDSSKKDNKEIKKRNKTIKKECRKKKRKETNKGRMKEKFDDGTSLFPTKSSTSQVPSNRIVCVTA